jgi:hypothetical protein
MPSKSYIVWRDISPIDFCLEWFGYGDLDYRDKEEVKQARDFRPRCIDLLSQQLGRSPSAIYKWGKSFERMPRRLKAKLPEILSFKQFWTQFKNLPIGTQGIEVRYEVIAIIQEPKPNKAAKLQKSKASAA